VELTGLRRRPKPRRYGVTTGLVSPDAKWYRSSHRPAIHRAHPPALSTKSRLRAFGFLDTAPEGPTRGVDNHYESPAAGPKHQRCTKDHAVKIILIWNRWGGKLYLKRARKPAFGYREPGPPPKRQRHESGWRGASAQASLSTGPRLLLPHVPWDPTLDASPARRSLVYALAFR
jgi:hypothetical protein